MLIAFLNHGKLRGKLRFDGQREYLEDTAEEIASAVQPFLERELQYKTSEWVDGVQVCKVQVASPGTVEHFSAMVWHYLPHRARIHVTAVGPDGESFACPSAGEREE